MFQHFPTVPPFSTVPGGCGTVSSVLGLNKGQEFWDLVGTGWYMNFDVSPQSYNRKTLTAYLAKRFT